MPSHGYGEIRITIKSWWAKALLSLILPKLTSLTISNITSDSTKSPTERYSRVFKPWGNEMLDRHSLNMYETSNGMVNLDSVLGFKIFGEWEILPMYAKSEVSGSFRRVPEWT